MYHISCQANSKSRQHSKQQLPSRPLQNLSATFCRPIPTGLIISKFNGTSTPKGSYSAKTGESTRKECYGSTDWKLHCLRTALCESIRYQAWTKCPTRPDTQGAPRGGCSHGPPNPNRRISFGNNQQVLMLYCRWYNMLYVCRKGDSRVLPRHQQIFWILYWETCALCICICAQHEAVS